MAVSAPIADSAHINMTPVSDVKDDKNSIPESVAANETQDEDSGFHPGLRFYLAFGSLAVLTLMVALDATTLSVALSIIAKQLNGTAIQAFWAGTSFLLCSTVFQPLFGSLSHIFGRKLLILICIAFFFVGTLVGGLSHGFTQLLIGRSLQGIGGGGVIVMTEIVVTDLIPLRLRGSYLGFIGAMWAVGSVSGPVIGGAFAETNWRWIFYLNFPFIGIGLVLVVLFLNLNMLASSVRGKLLRVDWIGSFIFVASSTSLLIPLTWGGVMYSWSSWRTLVPLILGAVGLIGFCIYEVYVAAEPVIRLSIFRNRTVALTYAGTLLHGIVLWCALYFFPLYFEGVRGLSPVLSGVAMFPMTFTVAPMSVATGLYVTWSGRYRPAIWLGWALATLGIGLFCIIDINTATVAWIFIILVPGIGLGILFPALTFAVQAGSQPQDLAFAVALFTFFRTFGQSLGVAFGGVIFQNQMYSKLLAYPSLAPYASSYSKDAAGLVDILRAMPAGADKLDLQHAYTDSLRIVWGVCCAFAGIALLLSLGTQHYDLDRPLETEQGLVHGNRTSGEEEAGVKA